MATAYWMLLLMVTLYFDRVISCPDGYAFCSDEEDECKFTGTVAYGNGDSYTFMESDGSISCTNDVFGDPLPNVFKQCCSEDPMVPIKGHFIVDGHPFVQFDDDNGCAIKPDECTPDSMTRGQHTINMDSPKMEIAVQCCTEDGLQAYRRINGQCITGVNYTEAVRMCSEEGLRLCTKQELLTTAFGYNKEGCDWDHRTNKKKVAPECTGGCYFNNHHIWTSTECSIERSVVNLLDGTDECAPHFLSDPDADIGIQCCELDGSAASFPDCIENADYATAAEKCSEEGLRLCDKEEVLNMMELGSDCPIDRVWTVNECSSEPTAAPTTVPTPSPTRPECIIGDNKGGDWSTGETIKYLDNEDAPNGISWTDRQCAEQCALSDECEFWTWGQSWKSEEKRFCRLMKNRGELKASSGYVEGPKDMNCITTNAPTPSPTVNSVGGWSFLWSDEFEGPEIDETVWGDHERWTWNTEVCGDRWQYSRIEDGMLVHDAIWVNNDTLMCGGGLWTQNRKSFLYGRFSIRAKFDSFKYEKGFCWWWLGEQDSWPRSGEINMPEGFSDGRMNWVVHDPIDPTIKKGTTYHAKSYKDVYGQRVDPDIFSTEFHTYTWEWMPDYMAFYFDGDLIMTYDMTPTDGKGQCGQNPYRRPGYMILDSGGDDTRFDWLRQWKWDPEALSAPITVTNGHGSGQFAVGTMAEIVAKPQSGYEFSGWTVESGNVILSDPSSSFATFTVSSGGATITANYEKIDASAHPAGQQMEATAGTHQISADTKVSGSLTVKVIVAICVLAVFALIMMTCVIWRCSKRSRGKEQYGMVTADTTADIEMDSDIEK